MRKLMPIIILILINLSLTAQNGRPFIRNYSPDEYLAEDQIWSIIQDNRGVMYFGSNTGVIEYDSKSWRKLEITNVGSAVLSMDVDENGTVYVGSVGEFGYLSPNKTGSMRYISLVHELDSADQLFSNVWTMKCKGTTAYFCADEALFRYNKDSLPKVKMIFSKDTPFLLYKSRDRLFMSTKKFGLMNVTGDSVSVIPGMYNVSPWFILPYGKKEFLIGESNNSLIVYDPNKNDTSEILSKYNFFNKSDIDKTNEFILKNQLYTGAEKINKNRYALGTINDGIIIIDDKGKILEHISKAKGLQSRTIHALYKDKQGELWAGLSYGLSRIEINSPFRIIDEETGIKGNFYNVIRFNKSIYITTNLGMFLLKGNVYESIKELSDENSMQIFFPEIYEFSDKSKELIVSTINGLYKIKGKHAVKISDFSPTTLYHSKFEADKIYLTKNYSLYYIEKQKEGFSKPKLVHKFNGIITLGFEEDKDNLWLFNDYKPVLFNLKSKKIISFLNNNEIRDVTFYDSKLIDGEIVFTTDKGLYRFNKKLNTFSTDNRYFDISKNEKSLSQIIEYSENQFWTVKIDDISGYIERYDYTSDKPDIDSVSFKRYKGYHTIYVDGDSLIWAISSKVMYKYSTKVKKTYKENNSLLFRKVSLNNDSVIFNGSFYTENEGKIVTCIEQVSNFKYFIDYKTNDISIEFVLPSFDDESSNEYSYYLKGGKNKKWSKWSSDSYKEYTNLYEGRYIFKVKARNIYGYYSEISEFTFEILPPWYRAWWAYIFYFLLLILLLLIIIKLNERRLKKENIRLDNIVKERTAEILLQKEEIQTQADHLEEINTELSQKNEEISSIAENLKEANLKIRDKNIYITDSINYAKRIQTAVLPDEEEIKDVLKDYFIIYKPKDIVGGDFYFVKKVNNYIILAVADCTGHGVPGGFLSMMGISMLNEIVQEEQVSKPADALELMRKRIKSSLRQKDYLSSRTDGIDIALCAINIENGILQYSGANIPAFIIRNGKNVKIEELKPDNQPVGIHYKEFPFTSIETKINKGDILYIFSDGIYDQLGGTRNRKYLISNLIKLLQNISHESLKIQRRTILNEHFKWKGNNKQVDDLLILGLKYSDV